MFIQTESTPNPQTVKFLPGQVVMEQGVAEFKSEDDAKVTPLGRELFRLSGVESLFFGKDFISVSKSEDQEWELLKPQVLAIIMQHFTAGLPLFEESYLRSQDNIQNTANELHGELEKQIIELIDTRVRPAVAMDGGDIVFDRFEDGVVFLHMRGACSGCPSSTATLKSGIENMLKHYVPEVQEVRPAEG